jgi:hypothetical protein
MKKIIYWREDVQNMSFDEFKEFHGELFPDDSEMKQAYKEVTGKDPEIKLKRQKGNEKDVAE